MIVSIVFFIIIFLVMVVSHEFGHYIVGKKNGIHANEFFVGIGPKLIKWTRDDTEFSVRLLPFGGACVFEGMDELEDSKSEDAEPTYSEHSFLKANVWARFATTLAGPLFNIILAYVCGVILASVTGAVIPEVQTVLEDSAAEAAGILPGDMILRINGHSVHLSSEVSFDSYYSTGEAMKLTILRDGHKQNVVLVPKYSEEDQRYYMGITNGKYIDCGLGNSLKYGFYNVEYILRATVEGIRMMFTGQVGKDELAGPVGIVQVVDDTYQESREYGFLSVVLSMINITMLLSANLAVMNLLPIPGLDGGRLLFIIIEIVTRRRVPPEKEGYVTLAGMALLMALVVFVLFNDISKFFR